MAMACGSAIGSAKVKFSEKNNGWRRLSEISRFCARKKAQGRGTELFWLDRQGSSVPHPFTALS
jgi:hypothetical protein